MPPLFAEADRVVRRYSEGAVDGRDCERKTAGGKKTGAILKTVWYDILEVM